MCFIKHRSFAIDLFMLVHKSHKVGVTFRKRLCCSYIKHFVQVLVYRQFGNLSTKQTNGKANHHYLEVNPGSGTIRWVFKTAQTFHQLTTLTFARFLPLVKKDKINGCLYAPSTENSTYSSHCFSI